MKKSRTALRKPDGCKDQIPDVHKLEIISPSNPIHDSNPNMSQVHIRSKINQSTAKET